MEQIGDMKLYTFDEVKDEIIGKVGTPERDEYERELQEELQAYHIGEAIKQARKEKNLTQEQLGELMDVKKAQVSRLENGTSMTWPTFLRALKALNVNASITIDTRTYLLNQEIPDDKLQNVG